MLPYSISDRAERDLLAIRRWYDAQGAGLGDKVLEDVRAAIDVARERPMSCPKHRGTTRKIRCKRSPYRVYFELIGDQIIVAAVYHTARRPSRWNDADRE